MYPLLRRICPYCLLFRDASLRFASSFEALAEAGSGRALVWIIEHARKVEERKEATDELLEQMGQQRGEALHAASPLVQ